ETLTCPTLICSAFDDEVNVEWTPYSILPLVNNRVWVPDSLSQRAQTVHTLKELDMQTLSDPHLPCTVPPERLLHSRFTRPSPSSTLVPLSLLRSDKSRNTGAHPVSQASIAWARWADARRRVSHTPKRHKRTIPRFKQHRTKCIGRSGVREKWAREGKEEAKGGCVDYPRVPACVGSRGGVLRSSGCKRIKLAGRYMDSDVAHVVSFNTSRETSSTHPFPGHTSTIPVLDNLGKTITPAPRPSSSLNVEKRLRSSISDLLSPRCLGSALLQRSVKS
ncbi:hypothetical protein PQX77_005011, partial [Marasmius sp. AFHP31]